MDLLLEMSKEVESQNEEVRNEEFRVDISLRQWKAEEVERLSKTEKYKSKLTEGTRVVLVTKREIFFVEDLVVRVMERKVAIKDGHRRVYFAVIIKEPPTTREGFVEDSGRKYQDDRSSVKTELVSYKLTRDLQKLVDDEWDRTDAVNDQELHWRILMLGVKVAKKFPSLGRDLFVDRAEIGSIVDTFTLRLTKADWEKFDAVRIREFEEVDGKILPEPDQPLVRRLFALALEESFKNQRAKVKKK